MGLFDTLRKKKEEYDNKKEAEWRKEQERRERMRRENAAREKAILEHLESGELMQTIVGSVCATSWFGESQGTWDSNRRQVIVSKIAVILNNHDENTFFTNLEKMSVHNNSVSFDMHVAEDSIFSSYANEKLGLPSNAEAINRNRDMQLSRYQESDDYQLVTYLFESYGYGAIEDKKMLGYFATALHTVLSKQFPDLHFSQPKENQFGFWAFDTMVKGKQQKTILPEHLR